METTLSFIISHFPWETLAVLGGLLWSSIVFFFLFLGRVFALKAEQRVYIYGSGSSVWNRTIIPEDEKSALGFRRHVTGFFRLYVYQIEFWPLLGSSIAFGPEKEESRYGKVMEDHRLRVKDYGKEKWI